jgi:ABC-type phosphate transport system permease subunit
MTAAIFILSLILGGAAAAAAGSVSGVRVGAEALGRELAAGIGGLYGLLAGIPAVVLGLIVLALI